MNALDPTETLDDTLAQICGLWTDAARNRKSPFHTPVVCSVADASPAPRIMVLRAASAACDVFRFHTDARSPKVGQIGQDGAVSILGYDPEVRIQLTVRGTGRIEKIGDLADTAWDTSALSSRRCYLAAHPPGTPTHSAISGLPDPLLTRSPTQAESLEGRDNFCVLLIHVVELEWLKLTSCGNKRALFTRVGDQWSGQWITP